jgi:hypothetical protein
MPADLGRFDLGRILTTLDRHDVEYLVVGGLGARADGATRPTEDVDFVPSSTRENLDRLAGALRELGARLRCDGSSRRWPGKRRVPLFGTGKGGDGRAQQVGRFRVSERGACGCGIIAVGGGELS